MRRGEEKSHAGAWRSQGKEEEEVEPGSGSGLELPDEPLSPCPRPTTAGTAPPPWKKKSRATSLVSSRSPLPPASRPAPHGRRHAARVTRRRRSSATARGCSTCATAT